MADIAPLITVEDYQDALEATLKALDDVLSIGPETLGRFQRLADADQWLDACRRALDEAKKRTGP